MSHHRRSIRREIRARVRPFVASDDLLFDTKSEILNLTEQGDPEIPAIAVWVIEDDPTDTSGSRDDGVGIVLHRELEVRLNVVTASEDTLEDLLAKIEDATNPPSVLWDGLPDVGRTTFEDPQIVGKKIYTAEIGFTFRYRTAREAASRGLVARPVS